MTINELEELINQALAEHDRGDYEHAEQLFLQALYLMDDKENEIYQRVVYGLGINYSMQQNYDGAKQCFEEARLNARKANQIAFELEMLHQLITLSYTEGDMDTAEVLLEETIQYRESHAPNDWLGLSAIYHEGGKVYLQLEQFPKSKHYFEKALELAEKAQNDNSIALINLELGNLYMHTEEYKKAKSAYEVCQRYYQNNENRRILEEVERRLQQIQELQ